MNIAPQTNQPVVSMQWNNEGAREWTVKFTQKQLYKNKRLLLCINNVVYSAPNVNEEIQMVIHRSPDHLQQMIQNLANVLKAEDREGTVKDVEIPTDINLSLMEILKASEYEILATCGGMALCATCHVQILEGAENLSEPQDQELDMLDTLPDADEESRLACQIRLGNENDGLRIKIKGALQ
ncbi:hypothetical protein FQR65_LT17352 [Abscondita terminalis]|nr:hypothetical protein FQR65_LT17352 [Abscondita terminalis]